MFGKLTESEMKFIEFVNMLGSTALYQMGKISNPITGKIEKDLNAAQMSIDILAMLKEKTKGNLTDTEKGVLEELLSHLQLNFIEEKKIGTEPEEKKEIETPPKEEKKKEEPPKEKEKKSASSDVELNWEKHERKHYGPDKEKKDES